MNDDFFEKDFNQPPTGEENSRETQERQGRDSQDNYGWTGNSQHGRGNRPRIQNNRERTGRSGYGQTSYPPRRPTGGYTPRPYRPQGEDGERGYGERRPHFNNYRTGHGDGDRPYRQTGYASRDGGAGQGHRPRYDRAYGHDNQRDTDWNTGRYDRPAPYPRRDNSYGRNAHEGYGRTYNSDRPYNPERTYNNSERPYVGNRSYQGGRPYNAGRTYGQGERPYQGGRRPAFDPDKRYAQPKRREYIKEVFDPNKPIRLNKYLANAGVCSRRDADKFIEAGVVSVNGKVVTELGTKVMRSDEVKFHDKTVQIEKKVYVLLNKPKGYVTTSEDPENRKTVMDLVSGACPERIYPVGRLDRNTTGVLLLTNDGELASKLTHPQFLKKKIYHVFCDRNVSAADLRQIAEGITLDDGEVHADAVEYASPTDKKQVGIEIHSGRNRIVRRIFESLGYHVVKLDRVYFAGLTKKRLQRGDWRYLTEMEVNMLRMGSFD